jgi:hypothetical protein
MSPRLAAIVALVSENGSRRESATQNSLSAL